MWSLIDHQLSQPRLERCFFLVQCFVVAFLGLLVLRLPTRTSVVTHNLQIESDDFKGQKCLKNICTYQFILKLHSFYVGALYNSMFHNYGLMREFVALKSKFGSRGEAEGEDRLTILGLSSKHIILPCYQFFINIDFKGSEFSKTFLASSNNSSRVDTYSGSQAIL